KVPIVHTRCVSCRVRYCREFLRRFRSSVGRAFTTDVAPAVELGMVFGQALTDCRLSSKLAQSPPRSTPAGTCPDPREGFAATSPTRTRDYSQKDFICRGPGLYADISAYGGPRDRAILEFHADAV